MCRSFCWRMLKWVTFPKSGHIKPSKEAARTGPSHCQSSPWLMGQIPCPPPQSEHRLILFKKKEGGREENIWRKWRYPRKPIPRKRKWAQEAPRFTEVGIRAEGEKSQSTGPARLAELVKNSFCYWLLSWYLSSVDSQNDLPSLRNNQTQSPEKSIRIQN